MNNGINIYVGNVARTVTEEQLKQLFAQYGQVSAVKLIKDKFTGEGRGFAFVDMVSDQEGKNAIAQCDGVELEGQRLRINEARPREERTGGDFRSDRGPRRPSFGNDRGPRY